MDMKVVKSHTVILKSLALKGAGHIQEIQLREEMSYPTTYRSIGKLEKLGLIWLSDIQDRGPKSAKEYSLTPLGIVASIVQCNITNAIEVILENWRDLTPKFVKCWKEIKKHSLAKDVLKIMDEIYLESTQFETNIIPEKLDKRMLVIKRNSLDQFFLTKMYDKYYSNDKMDVFAEIITNDKEYKEIWGRWYSLKKLIFSYLDLLNEKICGS